MVTNNSQTFIYLKRMVYKKMIFYSKHTYYTMYFENNQDISNSKIYLNTLAKIATKTFSTVNRTS